MRPGALLTGPWRRLARMLAALRGSVVLPGPPCRRCVGWGGRGTLGAGACTEVVCGSSSRFVGVRRSAGSGGGYSRGAYSQGLCLLRQAGTAWSESGRPRSQQYQQSQNVAGRQAAWGRPAQGEQGQAAPAVRLCSALACLPATRRAPGGARAAAQRAGSAAAATGLPPRCSSGGARCTTVQPVQPAALPACFYLLLHFLPLHPLQLDNLRQKRSALRTRSEEVGAAAASACCCC